MKCAGAGDSAGQNLCTLSHALLQTVDVFIVDVLNLIDAEHANFLRGLLPPRCGLS